MFPIRIEWLHQLEGFSKPRLEFQSGFIFQIKSSFLFVGQGYTIDIVIQEQWIYPFNERQPAHNEMSHTASSKKLVLCQQSKSHRSACCVELSPAL